MKANSILNEYYSLMNYNPKEIISRLSKNERKLYNIIKNNPGISKIDMSTSMCESYSSINRILSGLIKKSLIHIKDGSYYYPMSSI